MTPANIMLAGAYRLYFLFLFFLRREDITAMGFDLILHFLEPVHDRRSCRRPVCTHARIVLIVNIAVTPFRFVIPCIHIEQGIQLG